MNSTGNTQILLLIIVAAVFFIAVVVVLFRSFTKGGKETSEENPGKNRDAVLKEATRRLSSNPKDPKALAAIADLHFTGGQYEKSMKAYRVLLDMVGVDPDLDEFTINLRYGLSCMQCKAYGEAYKGLVLARGAKPDMFEINSNLGVLEYKKKNFEKATTCLKRALEKKPDHIESQKYLGRALTRKKLYAEAIPYLKQTVANSKNEKEAFFDLAYCNNELGHADMALKIFSHLRPDPDLGPSAAYYCGIINLRKKAIDEAIVDFEIALKHKTIQSNLKMDIEYRLAQAYTENNDVNKALMLYRKIAVINPGYKDVKKMITRFAELCDNQNFQTYILAPVSDFIALCRRLTTIIFPDAKIKVLDIKAQKGEYVDILAEVKTRKIEDLILFRFMRREGTVGELFIRDLYAHSKEVHAGQGFCLCPGTFSKEATSFVEARVIDLIEKTKLVALLSQITPYQ